MKIVLITISILLLSCASTPKDDEGNLLPVTLEQTVEDIISSLSEEDKKKVKEDKHCNLIRYHHGWGTGIRNHYGLWRGNTKLLKSVCEGKECHPDDASTIIIYGVWNKLNNRSVRYQPPETEKCEPDWVKDLIPEEIAP